MAKQGTMVHEEQMVVAVVVSVLKELGNRKGFDWWWDDLDQDIQEEIIGALRIKVAEALNG